MKQRDYNLDLIKTLAIIATVGIHLNACGSICQIYSKTWNFFVLFGSLLRFCVPVFCMATGYLLYTKDSIDINKILKKVLKFAIIFVLAEIVYRISYCPYMKYLYGEKIVLHNIIEDILQGNIKPHLYFLQIISLVYLFAPLGILIVKNENKELSYLLKLWIILSMCTLFLADIVNIRIFKIFNIYILNGAYNFIIYAMLGAYIRKYKKIHLNFNTILCILGFLIGYLGVVFIMWKLSKTSGQSDYSIWDSVNIFTFLMSYFLFVLALKVKINSNKIKKILTLVSQNTLGIYLVHVLFTDFIHNMDLDYINFFGIEKILILFIDLFIVLFLSLGISILAKKIFQRN